MIENRAGNDTDRLVEENIGLIYMVLKRFKNRGRDMEELFQVGAEGLTKAEAAEQKKLRAEYVAAFRNNLRGTLDSLKIQNPDGSIIDVKKRHEEKMKAQKEAELNNALKNGN